MQTGAAFLRKANAVFDRDYIVIPAVHNGDRYVRCQRRQRLIARHVVSRCEDEQADCSDPCSGSSRNVTAHARTYQHDGFIDAIALCHQFVDSISWVGNSLIIDTLNTTAQFLHVRGHRFYFGTPRPAFLPVRKIHGGHSHIMMPSPP